MSNSKGVPYFFNPTTRQSSWEPPKELTPEQISKLPGAEYLKGEEPAKAEGGKSGQVRASHLLVKHRDSRRPSSWKEVRTRQFSDYLMC